MEHENGQDRAAPMERLLYEVKKVIVGQDHLLERLVIALLSRGHILVEGVPGLAKTMAIKTVADSDRRRVPSGSSSRPTSSRPTWSARASTTRRRASSARALGPVFTNLLLADEINRAPAKVQSALLEVMQERQVTIGRETHKVPDPFLVLATQNPIETEGTYALPEAQVDRFMMKVLVGYPSETEEFVIVERMTGDVPIAAQVVHHGRPARDAAGGRQACSWTRRSSSTPSAWRRPPAPRRRMGSATSSATSRSGPARAPRSTSILTARALAFVRGRDYALPEDVLDMALDVLRHRLVLSFEALSDDVSSDAAPAHDHRSGARPGRPVA